MFPVKKRRRLPFPASPKLRVVQIGRGRRFDGVQLLSHRDANVLVGSASELKALAEASDVLVDHAVFVLTGLEDIPIDDTYRVFLWQRFGVPVFELLLDGNEDVLAAECEAHDGVHLTTGREALMVNGELIVANGRGKKLFTGLTGIIDSSNCPCGIKGIRLRELQLQTRRLAASA